MESVEQFIKWVTGGHAPAVWFTGLLTVVVALILLLLYQLRRSSTE